MKKIDVYDSEQGIVRSEDIGMDAENVDVEVTGLEATDAESAVEEILGSLSDITSGSGFTSGVVIDDVGRLVSDMGNINAGTDINGLTLDKVLKAAYGTSNKFSILHLSDTHNRTECITGCINRAKTDDDISFIIHTGDVGSSTYNKMTQADCDQPVLGIWGNHDAGDTYSNDNAAALSALRTLNKDNVIWGDDDVKYWYKDVSTDAGETIRFIALDEYDYVNGAGHTYSVVYSEAQMIWFLDLLYDTPSSYFIVLLTHQPLQYQTQSQDDVNAWTAPSENPRAGVGTSSPNVSWIPEIMKNYLNRSNFSGTFSPTYHSDLAFSVNKNFSQLEASATFICYLCGHTHFDWHDYLTSYPQQLMLCITRADNNVNGVGPSSSRDDVDRSETSWTANKVTFDLTLRKVIVERIGSTALNGGGVRDYIQFDF